MKISDTAQTKEILGKTYRSGSALTNKTVTGRAASIGTVSSVLPAVEDGATVALSAEGLGLSQKDREDSDYERESVERQMYQEMLESSKEAAKAQEKGFGDMAKALEIARRILNGDIVPQQDEQFLMEFNSEIYMKVKSMAKLKEDPEKYDSLMEEEDDEGGKKKDSKVKRNSGNTESGETAESTQASAEEASGSTET